MTSARQSRSLADRSWLGWWGVAAIGLVAAFAASGYWAYSAGRQDLARRAGAQAQVYRTSLLSELERIQHLPVVLAQDPFVTAVLQGDDSDLLNGRLALFAEASAVEAIYVMDPGGLTRAASNWAAPVSFLGQNYGFRPYFRAALAGGEIARFRRRGANSEILPHAAGPVRDDEGQVLGVVAVKIGLQELSATWADAGETVLVANPDGVVVLSANPDMLYSALAPLPPDRGAVIRQSRQFGEAVPAPLNWRSDPSGDRWLDGARYLGVDAEVGRLGWTLHYLAGMDPVWARVRATTGLGLIALLIALGVALFLRSRRIGSALRASQSDRRALQALNRDLAQQIEVRRAAEARLEQAQAELERTSKLAALGQLSASVTHELGQPISAMQNYIAAVQMAGEAGDTAEFVLRMQDIADRIELITSQLRAFARGGSDARQRVDLRDILAQAAELAAAEAARHDVEIALEPGSVAVPVHGTSVRLEQVALNLLTNGIHASADAGAGQVRARVQLHGDRALLLVEDQGAGIDPGIADSLFDPFVSTKPSGAGMGLGLAISREILADHDGTIRAEAAPGIGARFVVDLPLLSAEAAA